MFLFYIHSFTTFLVVPENPFLKNYTLNQYPVENDKETPILLEKYNNGIRRVGYKQKWFRVQEMFPTVQSENLKEVTERQTMIYIKLGRLPDVFQYAKFCWNKWLKV